MTEGTWDLYWIVTHPEARGRGVARTLVERMESELRGIGARLVRVETSHHERLRRGARVLRAARPIPWWRALVDFYKPGDDLIVMLKRL